MQWIRACWWAAVKPGENPSRPTGAWPGLRNTTSSAIKLSKQIGSPALTASIQVACTSRIARSSGSICNLRRQMPKLARPAPTRLHSADCLSSLRLFLRAGDLLRLSDGGVRGTGQGLPQVDLPRSADVVEEMACHLPGISIAVELEHGRSGELPGHRPDSFPPRQI